VTGIDLFCPLCLVGRSGRAGVLRDNYPDRTEGELVVPTRPVILLTWGLRAVASKVASFYSGRFGLQSQTAVQWLQTCSAVNFSELTAY